MCQVSEGGPATLQCRVTSLASHHTVSWLRSQPFSSLSALIFSSFILSFPMVYLSLNFPFSILQSSCFNFPYAFSTFPYSYPCLALYSHLSLLSIHFPSLGPRSCIHPPSYLSSHFIDLFSLCLIHHPICVAILPLLHPQEPGRLCPDGGRPGVQLRPPGARGLLLEVTVGRNQLA